MKALLSVYDKTGIADFAHGLHRMGVELVSTGGTSQAITQANLPVQQVSELTGFPEILDGRVKTLHPRIHGGILARRDHPEHLSQLASHQLEPIDLVVVNLYPFASTVSRPDATLDDALENIDIGGPTLLRAAAKNFPFVIVVVHPDDYPWVTERMEAGGLTLEERQGLARKAFQHVATYDATIAQYLAQREEAFPTQLPLGFRKLYDLRYGENPHQRGALYASPLERGGVAGAAQLHGLELSYVNILDADAAWRTACDFTGPTVAVVKHGNPCGLATHPDLGEAYRRAYAGDPMSAFGGIVASNRPITPEVAHEMAQVRYDIILAPAFDPAARELLEKRRTLRLLEMGEPGPTATPTIDYRRVSGGLLVQTADTLEEDAASWRVVTQRAPTPQELADLAYAWKVVKHIKSNAIVLTRDGALVGMGTGQPNRVTSVNLAISAAGEGAAGTVLASDAFFPFPDGVEAAGQAGVIAIAQPGGSIRDEEVTAAADRFGMAMVLTGVRHFRH